MKRASAVDHKKVQRLLGEIKGLQHEGLDYQHPKFKDWRREVESSLEVLCGKKSSLFERFKKLQFRSRGGKMWGDDDAAARERAPFKEDLLKAQTIIEEALKKAPLASEDEAGIDEEEFISSVSDRLEPEKETQAAASVGSEAPAEEMDEMATDEKMTLLMKQLEKDLKDPGADLRKVQKTMEELLKAKRKDTLVQRLVTEAQDPKAPWGNIRELMKGVWESDRDMFEDLLPELLED